MPIVTVETLRGLQWDKSNLWDIFIDGNTFQGMVPSNDISMGYFGIGTEGVGSSGLEIPASRTVPTFNLSYYDDEDLTMTKFFTAWLQSIASIDGFRYELLENIQKYIVVSKLDSTKQTTYDWLFQGYPTGTIEYHGDSDGSLPIYTLNFIITAGSMEWVEQPKTPILI